MPIAYSYDAVRGLIQTVATGHVSPVEAAAHFRDVGNEPWFPAPSLADVRAASTDMSGEEVRQIANHFRQFKPPLRDTPIAVVVSSELAYGLVRMMGLLLDDVAVIHPFRDIAAAMEWLAPHLRSASGNSH